MPTGPTPLNPITPNIWLPAFSLRDAVGKLPLNNIRNAPSPPPVPVCQATNVEGRYHLYAHGCATELLLGVMAQSLGSGVQPKLSPSDAEALQRSMAWLGPKSNGRFGNPVLNRFVALATMHAAVKDLLTAEPSNSTLIKCESRLRESIVSIAVASGKCEHPPQGGSAGGRTTLVSERMTEAGKCLAKCATALDTQALAGAVVKVVLPEALALAIGDRLGPQIENYKAKGQTSLDVMNVLNARAAEDIRQAVEHLLRTGEAESVQNGILDLLKIPEIVVQGQAGREDPKGPAKEAAPQMPAIPPELLRQANGAPIALNQNYAPTNIDFSKLAKALGGGGLNLKSLGNLLDRVEENAYRLGHADAENKRLLALAEQHQKVIEGNNREINELKGCNRELQRMLMERTARLASWSNGLGNREPHSNDQSDTTSESYGRIEGKKSTPGDWPFAEYPQLSTAGDMQRGSGSSSAYDYAVPYCVSTGVVAHTGRNEESSEVARKVSPEVQNLVPTYENLPQVPPVTDDMFNFPYGDANVLTHVEPEHGESGDRSVDYLLVDTGVQKRTPEYVQLTKGEPSEAYSSVASTASTNSRGNQENPFYVNGASIRSRTPSGPKLEGGVSQGINMLTEFKQVIAKKSRGGDYEGLSFPEATVRNAKHNPQPGWRALLGHVGSTSSARSRTPSGSSMGQGELPVTSPIGELPQLFEKTRPGGRFSRVPLPIAAPMNAKEFNAQQQGKILSINVDLAAVEEMNNKTRSSWELRVDPNGALEREPFALKSKVMLRAEDNEGDMVLHKVALPLNGPNRQYPLGSDGESLTGDESIEDGAAADVMESIVMEPTFLERINQQLFGPKRAPASSRNALANGSRVWPNQKQ